MRKSWTIFMIVAVLVIAALALIGCTSTAGTATTAPADTSVAATTAPALDGAALLQERCTVCHGVDQVTREKKTADGWTAIVNDMIGKGAKLSKDEKTILVDYLAKTYKP